MPSASQQGRLGPSVLGPSPRSRQTLPSPHSLNRAWHALGTGAPAPLQVGATSHPREAGADAIASGLTGCEPPSRSRSEPSHEVDAGLIANATRGGGAALDAATRTHFEARLGFDLGQIRVHSDASAQASAQALGARAFAHGRDLVFAAGEHAPASSSGRRLLAHELGHALQLEPGVIAREPNGSGTLPPLPGSLADPAGLPMATTYTEWWLQGFATDSDALTAEHDKQVAEVVAELDAKGLGFQGWVSIRGQADSRGSDAHNLGLGKRRADKVRASLAAKVRDKGQVAQMNVSSAGESENTRPGDVAEYRQVIVTVYRRSPTFTSPLPSKPPAANQPKFELPKFPPLLPNSDTPRPGPWRKPSDLPPWFWTLPAVEKPASPELLKELGKWLADKLGAADIAKIASKIAAKLGMDEAKVRKDLQEALEKGGEAGLKAALSAMIEAVAGAPGSPPGNPYGPVMPPELAPPKIFKLPAIPF